MYYTKGQKKQNKAEAILLIILIDRKWLSSLTQPASMATKNQSLVGAFIFLDTNVISWKSACGKSHVALIHLIYFHSAPLCPSLSPLTLSLFFFHLCDFLLYPSAFIFFILLLSAPSCGWSWVNETVGAHSLQHNETWSTHIHIDATTCWGTSMHTPRTKSSSRCSQLFQV